AFRAAISLAPTYAEPYVHLAALRARDGYPEQAISLMEQAVKRAASSAVYAEWLEAYRVLAGEDVSSQPTKCPVRPTPQPDQPESHSHGNSFPQVAEHDWDILQDRLTREGAVLLPGLLDGSSCDDLAAKFDDDALFAKTVVMDSPDFGEGV